MKKNNKNGFTLAELLIVVAIIAVLVAIAIPVFTTQLEKSRDATTVANLRSAYGESTALLLSEPDSTSAVAGNATKTAANVVAVSNVNLPCTCGKCDVSVLPFSVTAPASAKPSATVTFTFADNGTVSAVIS